MKLGGLNYTNSTETSECHLFFPPKIINAKCIRCNGKWQGATETISICVHACSGYKALGDGAGVTIVMNSFDESGAWIYPFV